MDQLKEKYKEAAKRVLCYSFPNLMENEIDKAIEYSMNKRLKDSECSIYNNYTDETVNLTLVQLVNYILSREPIMTGYGVLFKKHAECPNPLSEMIMGFIIERKKTKKKMFTFPKGSEQYEKHHLLEQLLKIDANGAYGACGQHTCLFFNMHVAPSITAQGRSLISAASLQFEMFLNNNCKFGSLNEIITYIGNVINEKRKFNDRSILDKDVSVEDCFIKIMYTCGFNYVPTHEDCLIVWNILLNLSQENINRLYYKNNLYEFMDNSYMTNLLITILQKLEMPFLDPNSAPDCIKDDLDFFTELLMEYVYYSHQIIDRLNKYDNMYRSVSIITDTDSSIISLDGWYHYALNKTLNVDMKIKHQEVDDIAYMDMLNGEEPEDMIIEEVEEYSFYDDDIMNTKRQINKEKTLQQDNVRYSIINIMAYVLDKVVNNYMIQYVTASNAYEPEFRKESACVMRLKNEFLFRRALLTYNMKNYASKHEIQEGNMIPSEVSLDVKGLPMNKSTLNKETRRRLKEILYEDILNSDTVDQIQVLKSLGKFEKDIYDSLASGNKEYYIPKRIKSIHSYSDPTRIQGIMAAEVYNRLRTSDMEPIDLEQINSIDVVKVNITEKNIESQKEKNPEIYNKLVNLFKDPLFSNKKSITSIAIPINEKVPDWLLDFIDYNTIINNNIVFPIESLGIYEGKSNYTNIVKI